jgi:hypothetical protein
MATTKVNENKNKAQKARGKQGAERQAEKKGGEDSKVEPVNQHPNAHLVLAPIQVDEARQALDEVRGELAAVRPAEIVRRRIDMQRAAAVVHSVAARDATPPRRAEFERLAFSGFYNLDLLARLRRLALAAWYVRYMLELIQFRASSATVPEEVVLRAQLVRSRMMAVIEYWLGDVPEVAQRLTFLRSGSGHQDLANDLQELARLYERSDLQDQVKPGMPNYYDTDRDEARTLAAAFFTGLGLSDESEVERWSGLTDRVWTLMVRTYDEHRTKGIFLFSEQEDITTTYPSLTSAVRSAPARRRPSNEDGDAGEDPTDEPGDEPAGEPDEGQGGELAQVV